VTSSAATPTGDALPTPTFALGSAATVLTSGTASATATGTGASDNGAQSRPAALGLGLLAGLVAMLCLLV